MESAIPYYMHHLLGECLSFLTISLGLVCQRPKAPAAPAPKPAAKKAGAWACWFGSKLCQSWRYSPRLVYLWICLFSENYEGHLQPMHIVIVAQRFLVAAAAAAAKQESQGSELRHYCNIHHGSDGYPTFDRYPFITIIYNPSFMVESYLLMDKSQFFLLKSQNFDTPPKSSSLPTNLDDLGLRWLKKPISDFYIFYIFILGYIIYIYTHYITS